MIDKALIILSLSIGGYRRQAEPSDGISDGILFSDFDQIVRYRQAAHFQPPPKNGRK
jgi:hypothetical protein